MAKVVIKKRIDLGFLGKDYEGGYVVFRSLSVTEVEDKLDEIQKLDNDRKQSVALMRGILKEQFIEGVFKDGDKEDQLSRENIDEFDIPSIIKFFEVMSGQAGDPKV